MACCICNTGKHPLRVDLRNGETVHLRPGQTSPALREELLYGNTYLADWEARGVVVRLPASMAEVIQHEGKAVAPRREAASPPSEAATRESGATEPDEGPANE